MMIILYEKNKIKADEKLIRQYLQNGKIAKDFAVYYDLFNKYRSDYQVEKILEEKAPSELLESYKEFKTESDATKKKMNNVFKFLEDAFGEGQEILILVTELTSNYHTAKFISTYGCEEYFKHNNDLLFYERQ